MLLLGNAQFSKAQYELAYRGYQVTFDSAVVITLEKYRQESALINFQSTAIDSLNSEIRGLYAEFKLQQELNALSIQEFSTLNKRIDNKDVMIEEQRQKIDLFYNEATKPTPFFERKGVLFFGGVLTGLVTVKLLNY